MSGLDVVEGDGHTLVPDDDREHLRLTYIITRGELNDAEQRNIAKAYAGRRPTLERLLDDKYLRALHRRMFGDVWDWAGQYRAVGTNIGTAVEQVAEAARNLVEDAALWFSDGAEPADAVRFYHRLVVIHPFVNGNGRHGRTSTDFLTEAVGLPRFTWGAGLPLDTSALRARHIAALRRADRGDLKPLVTFALS
jgi:Fic-DOC domain mobile mystery protein B